MSSSNQHHDSVIQYACKTQIKEAKRISASVLGGNKEKDVILRAQLHATSLLQRSVNLKHDRLAIERFRIAVQINASIDQQSLAYCRHFIFSFKAKSIKIGLDKIKKSISEYYLT